jgi:hypothetical protein
VLGLCGLAAIGLTVAGPAQAAHTCADGSPPVHFTPPADPLLRVDVEGKISSVDLAGSTVTANGMTFKVPETLKVKTEDLDHATGNLRFAATDAGTETALTDPDLEGQRSITGRTVIGVVARDRVGHGEQLDPVEARPLDLARATCRPSRSW